MNANNSVFIGVALLSTSLSGHALEVIDDSKKDGGILLQLLVVFGIISIIGLGVFYLYQRMRTLKEINTANIEVLHVETKGSAPKEENNPPSS